jgi:hypothetical protein
MKRDPHRIRKRALLLLFVLVLVTSVVVVLFLALSPKSAASAAQGTVGPQGPQGTQGPPARSSATGANGTRTDGPVGANGANGDSVQGLVSSVMSVGVSRATEEQTDNSNMADLRSRIDYAEVAAAAAKKPLDPSELAYVRALARKGVPIDLDAVSWLRGALSPARLDAAQLGGLASYTALQRVAMVRSWNKGARFVFKTETVALPRTGAVGPQGAVGAYGPQSVKGATASKRVAFGNFRHTLWTADARTAQGDVYLVGKSGTFKCIRCPKTDATQIPITVKSATDIPDGVAEPGLTFRDANVYMPPTRDSKPKHFDRHSASPYLANFPWKAYEPYESLIVENDFKLTSLMNTEFDYVIIPPFFAVYLTPHYHGYHASTQSCHRGFGLFLSSAQYGACYAEAHGDVVYGTCDKAKYPMCTKETEKSATSGFSGAPCTTTGWMPGFGKDGAYVPGVLLMNDDAGSEWLVRRGDLLQKGNTVVMACNKQPLLSNVRVPTVVNCAAAWNYATCPHYGIVRSHTDPWSGDQVPILDAVGDIASTKELFEPYHTTLGIVVTYRSSLA